MIFPQLFVVTNGKFKNFILQKQPENSFDSIKINNTQFLPYLYSPFKEEFLYYIFNLKKIKTINIIPAPAHCYCWYYSYSNAKMSQIYFKSIIKTNVVCLDLFQIKNTKVTFKFHLEKSNNSLSVYVDHPLGMERNNFLKLHQKVNFERKELYKPVLDYIYKAFKRKKVNFFYKWNRI